MYIRSAAICLSLFLVACRDSERATSISQTRDDARSEIPKNSKHVYRCEWSPLIDAGAKNVVEALNTGHWRVVADGVCHDSEVYDKLTNLIGILPRYTEQDFPFVGYCEHYLLTDGSDKGILIGFVCEDYGIVVWETELDADGRWTKSDSGMLRGKEEDKASILGVLSGFTFEPL